MSRFFYMMPLYSGEFYFCRCIEKQSTSVNIICTPKARHFWGAYLFKINLIFL